MPAKTPKEVTDTIKKLDAAGQGKIFDETLNQTLDIECN